MFKQIIKQLDIVLDKWWIKCLIIIIKGYHQHSKDRRTTQCITLSPQSCWDLSQFVNRVCMKQIFKQLDIILDKWHIKYLIIIKCYHQHSKHILQLLYPQKAAETIKHL